MVFGLEPIGDDCVQNPLSKIQLQPSLNRKEKGHNIIDWPKVMFSTLIQSCQGN